MLGRSLRCPAVSGRHHPPLPPTQLPGPQLPRVGEGKEVTGIMITRKEGWNSVWLQRKCEGASEKKSQGVSHLPQNSGVGLSWEMFFPLPAILSWLVSFVYYLLCVCLHHVTAGSMRAGSALVCLHCVLIPSTVCDRLCMSGDYLLTKGSNRPVHEHYALWFANALLSRSITYSSLSFHIQAVLAHYIWAGSNWNAQNQKERVVSSAKARVSGVGLWHWENPVPSSMSSIVKPIRVPAAQSCRSECFWKRKSDPCARKSNFWYPFYNIYSINGHTHTLQEMRSVQDFSL